MASFDLVLDAFCGCSMTIDAAESPVRIIGEPTTPNEAAQLAEDDKYQFQW